MIYKVPPELEPYLEWIPETAVTNLLTAALRRAIFSTAEATTDTKVTTSVDMEAIMAQLQGMLETAGGVKAAPTAVISTSVVKVPTPVMSAIRAAPVITDTGDSDEEDIQTAVDSFLSGLLK